jgi:hypothetical protein
MRSAGKQKSAAVAEFAFGADGAAMGQHDVFGDGKPESSAAGFAGAGFVDAVKALEEAREMFGGDAGAEILDIEFDAEFDAPVGRTGTEHNSAAGAAVLHRVVDQIRENLMDRFAVGAYARERLHIACPVVLHDLQIYALGTGDLAKAFGVAVIRRAGRLRCRSESRRIPRAPASTSLR